MMHCVSDIQNYVTITHTWFHALVEIFFIDGIWDLLLD
jgi:hypothetical protein